MKVELRDADRPERKPTEIRVPLLKRDIGLGSAIKAVTTAAGVTPCSPCAERAKKLDRLVTLKGKGGEE